MARFGITAATTAVTTTAATWVLLVAAIARAVTPTTAELDGRRR